MWFNSTFTSQLQVLGLGQKATVAGLQGTIWEALKSNWINESGGSSRLCCYIPALAVPRRSPPGLPWRYLYKTLCVHKMRCSEKVLESYHNVRTITKLAPGPCAEALYFKMMFLERSSLPTDTLRTRSGISLGQPNIDFSRTYSQLSRLLVCQQNITDSRSHSTHTWTASF